MQKSEKYQESLITPTPQEGWGLAVKLSRKSIAAIQIEAEMRTNLRSNYAQNPAQLIASAQVTAVEFKTIGIANNYWKP